MQGYLVKLLARHAPVITLQEPRVWHARSDAGVLPQGPPAEHSSVEQGPGSDPKASARRGVAVYKNVDREPAAQIRVRSPQGGLTFQSLSAMSPFHRGTSEGHSRHKPIRASGQARLRRGIRNPARPQLADNGSWDSTTAAGLRVCDVPRDALLKPRVSGHRDSFACHLALSVGIDDTLHERPDPRGLRARAP